LPRHSRKAVRRNTAKGGRTHAPSLARVKKKKKGKGKKKGRRRVRESVLSGPASEIVLGHVLLLSLTEPRRGERKRGGRERRMYSLETPPSSRYRAWTIRSARASLPSFASTGAFEGRGGKEKRRENRQVFLLIGRPHLDLIFPEIPGRGGKKKRGKRKRPHPEQGRSSSRRSSASLFPLLGRRPTRKGREGKERETVPVPILTS